MTGSKSTTKAKSTRKPLADKKVYLILDKNMLREGANKDQLVQKVTSNRDEVIDLVTADPNAVVVRVVLPRNPRNAATAGSGA